MAAWGSRALILGSIVAVLAVIGLLTVRAGRPASITAALARGEHPPAPLFTLPRLDQDGTLSLISFRGQLIVLNFWASWCIPCRDEAPIIEAIWQRYKNSGVSVVGVNVQDLVPEALRFMRETKTTYPMVRDRDNTVYRAYGLTGVPETFFVDPTGRIVRKFPGAVLDPRKWSKAVEDAIAP